MKSMILMVKDYGKEVTMRKNNGNGSVSGRHSEREDETSSLLHRKLPSAYRTNSLLQTGFLAA